MWRYILRARSNLSIRLGDGLEDGAEGVADLIGGSAGGFSEPVLELREELFDGVQVGRGGFQERQCPPRSLLPIADAVALPTCEQNSQRISFFRLRLDELGFANGESPKSAVARASSSAACLRMMSNGLRRGPSSVRTRSPKLAI